MTNTLNSDAPVAQLIKHVEMATRALLESRLRQFKLSSGQMLVLVTFHRIGQMTPAGLARELFITPQSVNTLLKPLEKRGLISKKIDEENRRRVLFSITDVGDDFLKQIRKATADVEDVIAERLEKEEYQSLRNILVKLI